VLLNIEYGTVWKYVVWGVPGIHFDGMREITGILSHREIPADCEHYLYAV
jgi:hypothetical protein